MIRTEKAHIRRVSFTILHFFLRIIRRIYFNMDVIGSENIPRNEPLIFAANHNSNMDPVLMGLAYHREFRYMAKRELFRNVLFRWLIVFFGAFPLNRGTVDRTAIRLAISFLEKGEPVLFFPEGTRGDGSHIQEIKSGTGFIIYMAKVRVVPAVIRGSEKVMPKGSKMILPRKITVRFGRPPELEKYFKMPGCRQTYDLITAEVQSAMRSLFAET